jgi:hypothetical protein
MYHTFKIFHIFIQVPKSQNFKVKFKLNITQGGGPGSQFYLMDIGSCWKNDGSTLNGNQTLMFSYI